MESESRNNPSNEPETLYRRGHLATEFLRLGPIKFIEGLRIMKNSYHEPLGNAREQLVGAGIIPENDQNKHLSSFVFGYFTDHEEWDEVLGLMDRGLRRQEPEEKPEDE